MIVLPNYEDLPIVTDKRSAEWAHKLTMAIVGDNFEGSFDFDLVERMVQAIRNEAAREVLLHAERNMTTLAIEHWREP